MADPLHTVVETAQFLRDAASAGMPEAERKSFVDLVAASPQQGVEIQRSGGVRKIRIAGRGKGKSGGYRAIAAFKSLTTLIARHWRERNGK